MPVDHPPKFLPTLTEVVPPPVPVLTQTPAGTTSSADLSTELLDEIRQRIRTELAAELQLLAMDAMQAQLDALMPVMERQIALVVQEMHLKAEKKPF